MSGELRYEARWYHGKEICSLSLWDFAVLQDWLNERPKRATPWKVAGLLVHQQSDLPGGPVGCPRPLPSVPHAGAVWDCQAALELLTQRLLED